MCEITESESLERRLESLAAENEQLRGANAALRFDAVRLRSEVAMLGRRFDAACELADRFKAERDAIGRRCYRKHIDLAGTLWWELIVDPVPDVYCDTDYDTEEEVIQAVYKAAGLDAAPAGEGRDHGPR